MAFSDDAKDRQVGRRDKQKASLLACASPVVVRSSTAALLVAMSLKRAVSLSTSDSNWRSYWRQFAKHRCGRCVQGNGAYLFDKAKDKAHRRLELPLICPHRPCIFFAVAATVACNNVGQQVVDGIAVLVGELGEEEACQGRDPCLLSPFSLVRSGSRVAGNEACEGCDSRPTHLDHASSTEVGDGEEGVSSHIGVTIRQARKEVSGEVKRRVTRQLLAVATDQIGNSNDGIGADLVTRASAHQMHDHGKKSATRIEADQGKAGHG